VAASAHKKPTLPRRGLLIWLSGADPDTLSRSPREQRKYSGLGGVVLTTSCMAGLSAGFALHTGVRAPLTVAVVIGVLWALAIANLDRWLVAAAARRERWWQNLATLVPRILLALVIGAVVSTPLVLWIFQREIQAQLTVTQQAERNTYEQKLRSDARFAVIPGLQAEVTRLQQVAAGSLVEDLVGRDPAVVRDQAEYDALDKRYSEARARAIAEFDGTDGTGQKGGGPAYKTKLRAAGELRDQRDAAQQKLELAKTAALARQRSTSTREQATAQTDLATKGAELTRLKSLKQAEEDRFLIDSGNDRGLLSQLEALSEITDSNATLKTAYLTLLLFITAIEILPVLTKFLLNVGPPTTYDEILATAEQNDVQAARARLEFEREQQRRDLEAQGRRQEEIRRETAGRQTHVQTEIRNRELDRWHSAELHRLSGGTTEAAARRTLRFPGPRRAQLDRTGYTEWPAAEPATRPVGPGTSVAVPEPAAEAETSTQGTTPRWRFK
jgi:hypothetical protein